MFCCIYFPYRGHKRKGTHVSNTGLILNNGINCIGIGISFSSNILETILFINNPDGVFYYLKPSLFIG